MVLGHAAMAPVIRLVRTAAAVLWIADPAVARFVPMQFVNPRRARIVIIVPPIVAAAAEMFAMAVAAFPQDVIVTAVLGWIKVAPLQADVHPEPLIKREAALPQVAGPKASVWRRQAAVLVHRLPRQLVVRTGLVELDKDMIPAPAPIIVN